MDAGLHGTLDGLLADPRTRFLCGGFGAVAEFTRDEAEPVRLGPGFQAVTARGGVRIEADAAAVPLAYETPRRQRGWSEALDLCLPRGDLPPGRTEVTDLGPDTGALRSEDRGAILFDLGLGFPNAAFCVRIEDPELLAVLRNTCGAPLFAGAAGPAMVRASPHRLVRSPLGRVEVYGPIPPPGGASPDSPHTHLLPRLLAHGLTHPANLPIPDGLVPCLSLFPRPSSAARPTPASCNRPLRPGRPTLGRGSHRAAAPRTSPQATAARVCDPGASPAHVPAMPPCAVPPAAS